MLKIKEKYLETFQEYKKDLENLVNTFLDMKYKKKQNNIKKDRNFLIQKQRIKDLGFVLYRTEKGYYRIYKNLLGKKRFLHLGKDLENAEIKIINFLQGFEEQRVRK